MLRELLVGSLLIVGVLFSMLASVGLVRMPDFLTRLQASTKAGTLGVACVMLGIAVWYEDFGVIVRALLVIAFFFFTAPVAAHLISRAAYLSGTEVWKGTLRDELRGHYGEDAADGEKSGGTGA
jgi:multicomponent Na+:H+ antiporter subunit G